MRRFDDFDACGDAVSGASLRLACDGVEAPEWTLGLVDLGAVVLQVASEGGGNICYGGNVHAGTQLFLPLTRAAEHVVNGEPLDDDSLLVIPRGADFRIRVHRRAHAWCSIGLPEGVPSSGLTPTSGRVTCGGGEVGRLRELHAVRRSLRAGDGDATVADVLVRHGVWEFGRFAARYRRHFGELPSETRRQAGG